MTAKEILLANLHTFTPEVQIATKEILLDLDNAEKKVLEFKEKEQRNKLRQRWHSMRVRCYCETAPNYKNYGGRGIKVCDEWLDPEKGFENYFEYVSNLPHFGEEDYSLDRIDNNGNYEPGNVRWATTKTQVRNRRNAIWVEYEGEKIPLGEAAEKSGLSYQLLISRILNHRKRDLFDPNTSTGVKGEKHHLAKLSADDVIYIRENYKLRDRKFGIRALARKFNVSPLTIEEIIQGKRYTDVK